MNICIICPSKLEPIDFKPSLPKEGARVHRGVRLGSHWAMAARCLRFGSLGSVGALMSASIWFCAVLQG